MILHHHPRVAAGQAFHAAYDAIRWLGGETGERYFQAWCRDAPDRLSLVDAAMLQIRQSGYMHNRLRMGGGEFPGQGSGRGLAAREQYFADQLNDFDFSANNGGWQRAASTWLVMLISSLPDLSTRPTQSEKFDPQGRFIRKYPLRNWRGCRSRYIARMRRGRLRRTCCWRPGSRGSVNTTRTAHRPA
ncbi:FAD-binding domain-containing protein [Cupriavidus basilensis]